MTCRNKVEFWVPTSDGWNYREVQVRCGNTDPHGGRAICWVCREDKAEMQRIQQHEENVAADNAALKSAGWGEM